MYARINVIAKHANIFHRMRLQKINNHTRATHG